jgi:hypothetical protein
MTPDSDQPWAIVTFDSYAHMFGPPNDEAFPGHPLAERGLTPYAFFVIQNSSWLRATTFDMEREFEVLKERPRVRIRLTRDSVAAGDDLDAPHDRDIETYSFLDPVALVTQIHPGYLPRVAGVGHSWECVLNDRLIAIVTVNGVVARVDEVEYRLENRLHFAYKSAG